MTTRQAAPVSRGAAPATVAECRREQLQAVARENLAAAAAKQQAVRAERTQQQPMTFFDRFSN
jgi:16S rRNA G966 N2-methylase RsmD